VLEEALDARVVEELPGASRYQFTHALIQATLADDLSRTRRARLHARIAQALEAHYGDRGVDHAAELAHHFGEAEAVLGAEGLIHYSALAGEAALATHAPEQALVHFERALAARGDAPDDDQAAELLFGRGRAQLAVLGHGELDLAVASFRRAFEHYVAAGEIGRALAVAAYPLPLSLRFGQTDIAELNARALALVSPSTHEAGALIALRGWFLGFIQADYEGAQRDFGQALAIAEREADAALERRTLAYAAFVDAFHLRWRDCLARGARAIELARDAGDRSTEIPARRSVVFALIATGEPAQGRAHVAAALAHAQQLREHWWLTSTSFNGLVLSLYEGDWGGARELTELGLAADPRDPRHLALRAVLARELGDHDEAEAQIALLTQVAERSPPPGSIADHVFLALSIALGGRIAGGDPSLQAVALKAAEGVLSLPAVSPALATYSRSALALIAARRGDVEEARRLYETLVGQRGTASFFAPLTFDRLLGQLAVAAGQIDAALAHFAEGLAFCDRAGYRPEYAWTAVEYAAALLHRAQDDDRTRAAALRDEALVVAHELGMQPLADRLLA
jgi:tetratricopeptide (TPR) repeat protein